MVVHKANENEKYENYPFKIVCISATLTILSYLFGTIVFYILHPILGILFLCLAIATIIISMKLRCTHCYYFGKYCNVGLGKLAALIFKKGDPSEFKNPKLVITTAIVSFGTMLLPLIAGIIIILMDLTVFSLSLFVGYILIGIAPNFVVRGSFCEKCVQGQLGCPSYEQMIKRRGS